MSHSLVFDIAV